MQKFDSIGDNFLTATRYGNMPPTPESQGDPFPEYVGEVPEDAVLINLPKPDEFRISPSDLRTILEQRRTVRRYDTEKNLTFEELSYLLWLTQGVKRISEKTGMTLRTVPSAGSRHPFETYLAVHRVNGLEPGIYHFIAQLHALLPFKLGTDPLNQVNLANNNQSHVINSTVTFIWVANVYRTFWRYGTRAYRYIYLDAGHVCQNLYLAAESIDCGVCAIGAFSDELANEMLGLDGKEQFTIYMASVGNKPPIQNN